MAAMEFGFVALASSTVLWVAINVDVALAANESAELGTEDVLDLQRLEQDLVGVIANLDYGQFRPNVATMEQLEPVYTRSTTFGFPGSAIAQVNFADGIYWMMKESMTYEPSHTQLNVVMPAGFVHDFASVPGVATSFVPKHGAYNRAAILHDFLYWAQPCSRLQSDNLFLIAMIEAGVSPARRWVIYRGVRAGGLSPWETNADERRRRWPRVVPKAEWTFSGDTEWVPFRRKLIASGVVDDVVVADKAFCEIGDSKKVPSKLLFEERSSH